MDNYKHIPSNMPMDLNNADIPQLLHHIKTLHAIINYLGGELQKKWVDEGKTSAPGSKY